MLRLERVSYRYAGARAPSLLEVDLELAPGEVLGVVGPSEAGKTTLCLVLSGLAPRVIRGTLEGRLTIDGIDMADEPMHALASRIGIGFENPNSQLSGVTSTVFEEVAFGPMNLGLPRAEVVQRTWSALSRLHIEDLAERDPARLSGGQIQLVALCGLLAMGPSHFVLDEPTAQLDPAGTRLVGDAIERLAGEGSSVVVVEQKTDLLARSCDRVVVLAAGRIVMGGLAKEVLADSRLEALGVAQPSPVRLARAAREHGLDADALGSSTP